MHLLLEYWDNGIKRQSQEVNLQAKVKTEDWFVQELYTGVFPLIPEAVKGHLVRPVC